jgi:hypothetical protein
MKRDVFVRPCCRLKGKIEAFFLKKYDEMDWINVVWDRGKWLAPVNRKMSLGIPYNAENFLTGCGLCSMELILLYGMRAFTKAHRAGRPISELVKPTV